jgi:integrase
MARDIGKLTAVAVKNATRRGLYGDGGGLYLQVSPAGTKSWLFIYKIGNKRRDMGLGPIYTVTLAEARQKALECRKLRLDGLDPLDARNAARQAGQTQARLDTARSMTFQACAEAYIAANKATWRNPKHAAQWTATLKSYAYPTFGALPVQAVDTGLVLKAVEPIWTAKPETASRVRGRIESVLDWATTRHYRQGDNPARWKGHLQNVLPALSRAKRTARQKTGRQEHHAALPYAEIAAFMAELRKQEGVAARALEFTVLTAARTGEVIGARWDEINMDERLWTVPAERMKAEKEHRVPLSDAALTIIEAMAERREGAFVFPGGRSGRPLSNMSMLMMMRRMGRLDLTTHGFRSSFRDWSAERTNFPTEVAEMALAHIVSDKVEAAYRRGTMFQKRRQLADSWAKFCASSSITGAAGKVVELRPSA